MNTEDNQRVDVAFIAPTNHIGDAIKHSDINMALAHLCDDSRYTSKFKESSKYTILDNSFFELGYCMDKDTMVDSASLVGADCIIMTDGTMDNMGVYKSLGYDVMYIPTTTDGFICAMNDDNIDRVGLSFFHASNMVGTDKNNPTSRYNVLRDNFNEGMDIKKIHMLGATDSAYEIQLCKHMVGSWDSSAAIWGGLNGIDLSTQTVKNSKIVDFNTDLQWNDNCINNINFIKGITR